MFPQNCVIPEHLKNIRYLMMALAIAIAIIRG